MGLYMRKISRDAGCSKMYTNACVGRTMCGRNFSNESGFTEEQIKLLTSPHKIEGKFKKNAQKNTTYFLGSEEKGNSFTQQISFLQKCLFCQ